MPAGMADCFLGMLLAQQLLITYQCWSGCKPYVPDCKYTAGLVCCSAEAVVHCSDQQRICSVLPCGQCVCHRPVRMTSAMCTRPAVTSNQW